MDTWWSVSAWPNGQGQALIGVKAKNIVSSGKQPFSLSFHGHTIQVTPAGTVKTGAAEDSRIFISLADFQNWTGLGASTLELAVLGSSQEVDDAIRDLSARFPDVDVHPVRQIVEGQARVLNKTRSTIFACSLLIIVTAALCVLSTLLGWVFDRRADFAIMKALGASEKLIAGFFAAESIALGVVGGFFGFAAGTAIADWIGHANFHTGIAPRLTLFPSVLAGSILVTLVAAIVPIILLRQVEPAMILKGE
jgi:putative ABC transport system permease protein